jgi:hypothetical protein
LQLMKSYIEAEKFSAAIGLHRKSATSTQASGQGPGSPSLEERNP